MPQTAFETGNLYNDVPSSESSSRYATPAASATMSRLGQWINGIPRYLLSRPMLMVAIVTGIIVGAVGIYVVLVPHQISGPAPGPAAVMRAVNTAQITFFNLRPKVGFACDLGTLEAAGLIEPGLTKESRLGYLFAIVDCKHQNGIVVGYRLLASPSIPETTGTGFMCGDETGTIKFSMRDADDCFRNGQPLR